MYTNIICIKVIILWI